MVVGRIGALAQNALEVARFGGLDTDEEASPSVVVAQDRVFKLRRYFAEPGDQDTGAPVVLVPPMMLAAEVYDVAPSTSAVRLLRERGVDPWVVDFGAPEEEEGGLERDLADHVLAVSRAVDLVRERTGQDVHLGGYSQGGMFCYQAAAYRRGEGLASLITFGSPVDTRGAIPFGLPEELVARGAGALLETVFAGQALPAWASRLGFRLLDPVKAARQQLEFVLALHDREALLPRERQRRFLQRDGWVAWPGPALADFMRQFVVHNRMLVGGFTIEDRLVTLADIAIPVLTFVGEVDEIAPPAAVRPIVRAAPRAEVYEKPLRAGHFGLVVGSAATSTTWPVVAEWTRWVAGDGDLPEGVEPARERTDDSTTSGLTDRVVHGVGLTAQVGLGAARSVVGGVGGAIGAAQVLATEAATQLPRLTRLERVRPTTRISLGLVLDEHARRSPEGILFLWEDRAHTHAAVGERIDNVVKGLVSLGVRQGEHVGVLMDTRPSALVLVAALSRLGAVGVMLRPGGDVAREAELGQVTRIVTDPERIDEAADVGVQVLVLGGGGEMRQLPEGVVDMERIDPDAVLLPRWYRPNPGLARDLAFVLFTGEGDRLRVNRFTNRRWALSAFGTASSAALDDGDTVYSVSPVHHPSALLVSLGGAVAGGSRIALARQFDPDTFWQEVRRYGVTVASYTWTMLRTLVEAPPSRLEQHHSVRLFVGSGMPVGLWRRVSERFAPAKVIEFYASAQGEAILVNITGAEHGVVGRPLPGSAEVRIAAWDVDSEAMATKADGFARECGVGEVGMLLARADTTTDGALRGVFSRGDAWVSTGDLFWRDDRGNLHLHDTLGGMVRTANGLAAPAPCRAALEGLDSVLLAASYGVSRGKARDAVLVAAVQLVDGAQLTEEDLDRALAALDPVLRPTVVRVVDEIPVTSWYRPRVDVLRRDGIPAAGDGVFYWDAGRRSYRPLSDAARRKLLGQRGASSSARRKAAVG